MPYAISVGSVLEIVFEGKLLGQQTITSFCYLFDTGSALSIPDGRAAVVEALNTVTIAGGMLDKYLLACSDQLVGVRAYGQWITPIRYAYVQAARPADDGQIAQLANTPNIAGVITRRGEIADRRNISSTHMPAVPASNYSAGTLVGGQITLYETLLTEMLTNLTVGPAAVLYPCAFHRALPSASRVMKEGFVEDTVRVMRRRTVGVGA